MVLFRNWTDSSKSSVKVPILFGCIIVFTLQCPGMNASQNQSVMLEVPTVKQPYMRCLVASVSMVLHYWGREISTEDIEKKIPVYREGTIGRDLVNYVNTIGFNGFLIQPPYEDLLDHLAKGRPLIVALHSNNSMRHAVVLVGYNPASGTIYLNDPAKGKRTAWEIDRFRLDWENGKRWTLLIVPQ
jgi:ABC-type bacteriocin/lantibiotic exporter with double-glycine peptidase domain